MHVHISPVEFLAVACYLVIFGFFWRTLAARWSENPVGKAMAFVY